MSTAQLSSAAPAYPDRSTRLLLFGIFQILLGCLCGLMCLMMVLVTMLGPMAQAPQGQPMNAQMNVPMNMPMMISGVVFYLLLAVGLIWLGVGSIRARRWAWTLTVVLSWMWLIMGVAAFVMFVFVAGPMMRASMAQQAKMPPEALVMIQVIMGMMMACIYILLPAAFLLSYQWPSVRATCQRRDPKVRWTDRCPMPVLALTILMGFSAVSMPLGVAYGSVMPLFGAFISGPVGTVVILLVAVLLAYLAWGMYRLKMAAWWGAMLLWIVGAVNMVVTFSQTDLMEMYEKMQMPAAQLEMMQKSGMIETMNRWMPWMGLAGGVLWLGYLLYVRRYFVRGGQGMG